MHAYTHMPSVTLQPSSGTRPPTPLNKALEFTTRAFHRRWHQTGAGGGCVRRDDPIIIKYVLVIRLCNPPAGAKLSLETIVGIM